MSRVRTAAAALSLLALTACTSTAPAEPRPQDPGAERGASTAPAAVEHGWARIEGFPLSDRTSPVLAAVGGELYVLGGNTGFVCPPNADCASPSADQLARDGAAYDPGTGTWRRVADLPDGHRLTAPGTDPLVVDGLVLVPSYGLRGRPTWLAYDTGADRWDVLDAVHEGPWEVVTDGEEVWVLRGRRVLRWDPRADTVTPLATYDAPRPLVDRALLPGPDGPVVSGYLPGAAADEPSLVAVDVPEGSSWRRLRTEQIGWLHHFTGTAWVGLESGRADGGATDNWGRWYDQGGLLDARTGRWSPLDVPQGPWNWGAGWSFQAASGDLLLSGGRFRDLSGDDRWRRTGRPEGSRVDTEVVGAWLDGRLYTFGGVDEEGPGYEGPAPVEVFSWTP